MAIWVHMTQDTWANHAVHCLLSRPFNHTFSAGGGTKRSNLHSKLKITNSMNYHEELSERLSDSPPIREKVCVCVCM